MKRQYPGLKRQRMQKRYEPKHYPHFNLGRIYLAKGMINKALEEFHKSLEHYPDYPLAREAVDKIKLSLN